MKKFFVPFFIFSILSVFQPTDVFGKDVIRVNGPYFSGQKLVKYENLYNEFFVALDQAVPDFDLVISFKNTKRALREVAHGYSDLLFPMPCRNSGIRDRRLTWGTQRVGYVPFGIYSRRSDPITRQDLDSVEYKIDHSALQALKHSFSAVELNKLRSIEDGIKDKQSFLDAVSDLFERSLTYDESLELARAVYPYVIETERMFVEFVSFPAFPDPSPQNSLRKLMRNRIDAYVFPAAPMEALVVPSFDDELISRDLYDVFELCTVVANSERGKFVDQIISDALKKVLENGEYDRIFRESDAFERKWVERYKLYPKN